MKTNTFLYILRLALTLLAITAIMAAALAGVNQITKDRISEMNEEKTEKAIQEVLDFPYEGMIEIAFTDDTGLVKRVYRAHNEPMEQDYAYAVEVAPTGFDGEISMMVGVDRSGAVLGISIISHTETAGLGAVAAADSDTGKAFRSQFGHRMGTVTVTKDGGEIDAITGATVTSRAICQGVNAALECVHNLHREVQP